MNGEDQNLAVVNSIVERVWEPVKHRASDASLDIGKCQRAFHHPTNYGAEFRRKPFTGVGTAPGVPGAGLDGFGRRLRPKPDRRHSAPQSSFDVRPWNRRSRIGHMLSPAPVKLGDQIGVNRQGVRPLGI